MIPEQELPVSIILPIRNEAAFIAECLGAVLAQDYPPDKLEILIADGMSDDNTLDIIRSLPGAERVTIIPNPDRIQAAGLNRAIEQATGDIIVRVDGHAVIAPDYVRMCVKTLRITGADNVGGAMNPVGITPMGKAIAAAGKSSFAVPTAFHVSQTPQYTDTVYLGAWPRTVFERVGRYRLDVGVNEDYELNFRIRASGGKIFYTPEIRSLYYGRQTLSALWKQYFRYGTSKVKTLRKHPASLRPRQLVAPVFVAGLIGGAVLGHCGCSGWRASLCICCSAWRSHGKQRARMTGRFSGGCRWSS
ncbi:glycosyltransferase family 2 protein [Anaerolineae bacterium CFX9]|nr:glycosyltransferase family 2 protein [Anaerolineae bacterium CFX9]